MLKNMLIFSKANTKMVKKTQRIEAKNPTFFLAFSLVHWFLPYIEFLKRWKFLLCWRFAIDGAYSYLGRRGDRLRLPDLRHVFFVFCATSHGKNPDASVKADYFQSKYAIQKNITCLSFALRKIQRQIKCFGEYQILLIRQSTYNIVYLFVLYFQTFPL